MPSLFSRKPADPAGGAQPMTMAQFIATAKADGNWGAYTTKFGDRLAQLNLMALYDRNLRMMTDAGVWDSSKAPDYNRVAVGNMLLKVKPGDMATFSTHLSEQLRQDVAKTNTREIYLQGLKADALAGRLYARLQAATLAENTYYNAPPPAPPRVGAPPIPPKPPRLVNRSKAIAWAVGNPGAGADLRNVYAQAFDAFATGNGRFPLSSMDTLNAIWRKLVTGAPHYRPVNFMLPVKYPSSLAGGFILKNVIEDFKTTAQPAQGDNRWYDWALYFFAAIMTSQAFTDGNKRVSRLAYGLVLVEGGVDFIAPNGVLGPQLGDM